MKCDQDLCLNFWYDFKMLLWQDELNPQVRCAFGNVFIPPTWRGARPQYARCRVSDLEEYIHNISNLEKYIYNILFILDRVLEFLFHWSEW